MMDFSCDDRSVSELVGFTLTFSVVVAAVALVYVSGFGVLEDVHDRGKIESSDRSMRGLAESFDELHSDSVPGRSIELDVDGGQLETVDTSLDVNVSGDDGSYFPVNETVEVDGLTFVPEGADTEFAYEGGGVFRERGEGALVRHPPSVTCTDDAAVVSLVHLDGDVQLSAGGTVTLVGERQRTAVLFPDVAADQRAANATDVTVRVRSSAYNRSWDRFFDAADRWEPTGTRGEYVCSDVDSVTVRVTEISLRTIY